MLRARNLASANATAKPLAIVSAPFISERMEATLEAFVAEIAKDQPWGLLDDTGRILFAGDRSIGRPTLQRRSRRPEPSGDLFSDLNQWLLKVLLAERLPARLANQSAPGPFFHATRLAERAEVSLPVVTRLIALLEKEGFAEEGARPLSLIRIPELLERWRNAGARSVRREFFVRLADSSTTSIGWMLQQDDPDLRTAFGLFSAAESMGVNHATGVPEILYLDHSHDDVDENYLQKKLGLLVVSSKEHSDFRVWVPRFPESVFRGAITRPDENAGEDLLHRYTDVIQTWIDLSHFPARGLETAHRVWLELIEPHLVTP